jgi:DNA-binding NarL/FixJ family response regulator
MPAHRVILADDHVLVRAGIRALIESIEGVEVIGEAGDGREAIELALRLHPDIALLDIAMAGLNGLDAASRLRDEAPATRVIILSMHSDDTYVRQALKAGVTGYLLKSADAHELQMALDVVSRGDVYLSPSVSTRVARAFGNADAALPSPLDLLTSRQREILQLIAEGRTTKEIAFTLNISAKTVETHRAQIMERLDVHDVPGLVRFAIRAGLITADS